MYHEECINTWFEISNNFMCPTCKDTHLSDKQYKISGMLDYILNYEIDIDPITIANCLRFSINNELTKYTEKLFKYIEEHIETEIQLFSKNYLTQILKTASIEMINLLIKYAHDKMNLEHNSLICKMNNKSLIKTYIETSLYFGTHHYSGTYIYSVFLPIICESTDNIKSYITKELLDFNIPKNKQIWCGLLQYPYIHEKVVNFLLKYIKFTFLEKIFAIRKHKLCDNKKIVELIENHN